MDSQGVLRLKEAAGYVRVSEKTLRELAKLGRVPCQRVGREWRFLRRALDDWLAGGQQPGRNAGKVAEPATQLYLPSVETVTKPNGAGFGDTAFTGNRQEPVHRWVPWIAGFSASFVAEILDREASLREGSLVLDPFAGVGTTLVEAVGRGASAIGFEINPFAALACEVKVGALSRDHREIERVAAELRAFLKERLRRGAKPKSDPPPGFRTRDPFFSPRVEKQVLLAKDFISRERRRWLRDLLRVALGAVLVGISNYSYEPSLGRRVAAGKSEILDADLPQILHGKLLDMARDIEGLRTASSRRAAGRVFSESYLSNASARLKPGSVDVLITSPPYLNNYHYVRNTRPQLFWLDLVGEPGDLRSLEQSSFGKFWQTVRGLPEIPLALDYPALEEKLSLLRSLHPDRGAYGGTGWANYAATYFNDCAAFCHVTAEVMKPGGLAVVVIGNNILQGVEFKTDQYFAHIAEQAGFEVQELHRVRKKRTGSSIVNSSVRVGVTKKRTELYETAVELRMRGGASETAPR